MTKNTLCPCGSGKPYAECCGPLLAWQQIAETAEQLMRSRYTAYTQKNTVYLLHTWHATTRPADLLLVEDENQWIGLKILAKHAGGKNDEKGQVEFLARFKINGKAYRLHEKSEFIRENGQWYYVSGDIRE